MTAQLREYSKTMKILAASVEEAYDHSATALPHSVLHEIDPPACPVPFLLRKAVIDRMSRSGGGFGVKLKSGGLD